MTARNSSPFPVCLAAVFVFLSLLPSAKADPVSQWLAKNSIDRGICVLLGDPSGKAAIRLAGNSHLLVYTQLRSMQQVVTARRAAEAAGLDATRIQVERGDLAQLHLAENLANAVVVVGQQNITPESEILRVLCPRGKALLGDKELIKPVPPGIDDWTHPYHGPDNNPLSTDTTLAAPYLTQFLADPRYGPAPQTAVASAGKVFKVFGNVAWHEREEPFLNTVVAYDGYNGTMLWKYPLPKGMMVHRNVFVATPETLFLGDDKSCKLISTSTGKVVDEIRPPEAIAGGTFWKWMAIQDGVLYAITGEQEMADKAPLWRRQAHGWPWTGISDGYNQPQQPWGYGRNVLAIDLNTKKLLWSYREEEPIDTRAVCMSGTQIFAFRFGEYLTCLDARTGTVLWRKTKQADSELFQEFGEYQPRQSWQTNWRTAAYLKCSDKALYFAGTQMSKLIALSTKDGSILWEDAYDNYQLILRPDAVYGISGPWGNNVSKKFDPLTGSVLAELPTGRRACTRPTSTMDSILFRAMGGSIRFDIGDEQPHWLSPMRPGCHDGVTIANGLLYWWPYTCDCQLNLYGVTCLTPAGDFDFSPDSPAPSRLETSPEADRVQDLASTPADWPTFRANNQATGKTEATIPRRAQVLWKTRPAMVQGARPTAPVAVGELVFVAGSDGVVRALNATDGQEQWTAHLGSEIRLPPTIWNGRAVVGSGDGWVYAFEAASGKPLWRFRAAPAQAMVPIYGRLLSRWPVASGILIEDGTAYFASGIVNYDGTYVYALDPSTGSVKWCNSTSGHLAPHSQVGVSVQGHLLANSGKLYLAGGNAVSPAIYDQRDGRCLNDPAPLAQCESTSPRGWELSLVGDRVVAFGRPYYSHPDLAVYDHTVSKKILHARAGARDIVWIDNQSLRCFEPIDNDSLNRCVSDEKIPRHITQAWGEFQVDQEPIWGYTCSDSVAIAIAKNAVVIADKQKVVAVEIESGKPLWGHPLPAPPVPWGLAVDRAGRVILTLTDGQIIGVGSGGSPQNANH